MFAIASFLAGLFIGVIVTVALVLIIGATRLSLRDAEERRRLEAALFSPDAEDAAAPR